MSGFTAITWDGWEKYHALTLTLTQRAWRGLVVNANYTWSKALDDASNPGANNAGTNVPQDPTNYGGGKGTVGFRPPASFRHQLSLPDSVPERIRKAGSTPRLAIGR